MSISKTLLSIAVLLIATQAHAGFLAEPYVGITSGAKIEKLLRDRLGELKSSQVVLACTHYPAAQKTFEKLYSMSEVIDPALAVGQVLKKRLLKKKLSKKEKYKLMVVFTTGSVKTMPKVLKKAFGIKLRKKLFKSLSV